jgi:hypothetical protein
MLKQQGFEHKTAPTKFGRKIGTPFGSYFKQIGNHMSATGFCRDLFKIVVSL